MKEVIASVGKYGVSAALITAGFIYNIIFLILGIVWGSTALIYDLIRCGNL